MRKCCACSVAQSMGQGGWIVWDQVQKAVNGKDESSKGLSPASDINMNFYRDKPYINSILDLYQIYSFEKNDSLHIDWI